MFLRSGVEKLSPKVMTRIYNRSLLLSLKSWWRNQNPAIKPLKPTDWNALKAVGILKPTRRKRGGAHCKRQNQQIKVQALPVNSNQSLERLDDTTERNQDLSNLLNIQNETFLSNISSPNGRSFFVPSLLLSNTMSLAPKIDEITYTISSFNPDIAFFTETWLNQSVPDDQININGYQLYRRDRVDRSHGGVCFYVKASIQCMIIPDLQSDEHEALWAVLRPSRLPRGYSNIIVGVVYHPPNANDATKKEYLMSSLEQVESKYPNSRIILTGDFNRTLEPMLKTSAKIFQLKPIVHFPTRGANTLDQIFTNLHEYYSVPCSLPPFGLSDHLTVTVSAKTREQSYKPKRKIVKARDKRPSKLASVGRFLLQVPWSDLLSCHQSSETKLQILTDIINYGLDTIMPERSVKIHESDQPWMNNQLKALILRRQKALASGNMVLFKILRNKVNRECKRCRRVYYENKVKDLHDTRPRDWWREVKQLCGTGRSTGRDLKSILHPDLVCDEAVLVENINSAFVSVTKDYSPLTDEVCVPIDDDQPIYVTEASVTKQLHAVRTSRAGGPDNLPNWVLREFADILAAPVTDILNTSFSQCKVPHVWKLADIAPLPKSSTICDFTKDLRPISLTSTLSKIAESLIIEKALKPAVLSSIDPCQYGFIPGSSTTYALISMFHHWLGATDGTGATVRTALLDYRKAFDLVDHHILTAKLLSLNVKPTAINWIIDFLRDRQQRVKLSSNCFSSLLRVPAGVPQGTRLGPWLFLVMINDLKVSSGASVAMWKFADDTTISEIVPPSKQSHLQQAVDNLNDWSRENLFQLNPIKCKEITTCFKRSPPSHAPVEVDGLKFESVTSAKVLGVTIRNDFKWNDHIEIITSKASKRLYLLRQLKRAGVSANDLVLFYCSVIRSVLDYSCQLFHHSLPKYLSDEMERIQKRAMRTVYPDLKYKDALEVADIPTLYTRRETLSRNLFKDIIDKHDHKLVNILPPRSYQKISLRKNSLFHTPVCRTERFKNSFIMRQSIEF